MNTTRVPSGMYATPVEGKNWARFCRSPHAGVAATMATSNAVIARCVFIVFLRICLYPRREKSGNHGRSPSTPRPARRAPRASARPRPFADTSWAPPLQRNRIASQRESGKSTASAAEAAGARPDRVGPVPILFRDRGDSEPQPRGADPSHRTGYAGNRTRSASTGAANTGPRRRLRPWRRSRGGARRRTRRAGGSSRAPARACRHHSRPEARHRDVDRHLVTGRELHPFRERELGGDLAERGGLDGASAPDSRATSPPRARRGGPRAPTRGSGRVAARGARGPAAARPPPPSPRRRRC